MAARGRSRAYDPAVEAGILSFSGIAALVVVVCFAFVLGVSDAPNASAVLIASRAASYRGAMAFSFVASAAGALFAGEAVALTMTGLVHVSAAELPGTYLAGGVASLAFTLLLTRRGVPVSASIALVGGLAGAAGAQAGWGAVGWGGFHGAHPYGVIGTLIAIFLSPLLGGFAAAGVRRLVGRVLPRASREIERSLRGAIWLTAGLVGLADGSNDGQKAMGLATALLVAAGTIQRFAVPFWVTALVALVLATGTAAGGRRIVRTVSSRFYRGGLLDGLAAQSASAVVILGAASLGAPVSTSTVVTSGMIGVGAARRRRHVHWPTVRRVLSAWVITVPACALLGAGLIEFGRLLGALR
jgi:PiT family inorganic phosphate transporter